MTTIAGWLRDIGLEDQKAIFAGHDIDMDVLPTLTEADLRELGLSMGIRKKLLKAIAELNHRDRASLPKRTVTEPNSQAVSPGSNVSEIASAAERRQLTILFCDLVGSTQLSQQLDPETLRDLMRSYQQACRAVIEKYDGHVAQYLGDGLMVYFGFPRAHEDDAERAARAALEIISSVKKVAAPASLCVRIGIATGRVVVGETGAGDASVPKLAVGETPNLAARLQGLAGPDEILIAPSTHRLLGAAFEYLNLGEKTLKGIVEPVHAFRVLRTAATEGRFEATHREQLAPIIGRESEIALLIDRWQQSQAGEGQVALLAGEPGIGKSRITRALREQVGSTPHLRLRFQCSPYHTNSAFYPLIQQLERAAGFSGEDTAEQKLGKIEAIWLDTGSDRPESLALIAALLALPLERYPPLAYAPHKQKEKTFHALLSQIETLARQEALLLVFEDVHWIDPTTQEWLDLLVTRLPALRALLVVTHRPEYTARWGAQAHVTTLALNRLGKRQGAQLVERVSGGKPLPREVLEQILAKTDGVPLFVEEITNWVLESGLLKEESDRYMLTGPLPPLAIPSTLHDSLMARLDRLASVKEVAQIAACIGREFSHELLAAVASLEPEQFKAAVSQLIEAQLIFRVSSAIGTSYVFKHALVQDAAYESLLKSKRQQLHASVAEAFVQRFPEQAELAPAVVARHYTQASLKSQAVTWWRKASALAIRRNAPVEAIDHCNKGLAVLALLEHDLERDRTELGIQLEMGSAVLSIMGWADPRAGRAFERAMALSQMVGGTPEPLAKRALRV